MPFRPNSASVLAICSRGGGQATAVRAAAEACRAGDPSDSPAAPERRDLRVESVGWSLGLVAGQVVPEMGCWSMWIGVPGRNA
uniref:Uncharacterized protein n=1 Tax=Oryza meridionalis TaxID=40149 RepID=A0A0E0ERI1_9ORYZ